MENNQSAIGKTIITGQHEYRVIGVVQDFNYASVKQRIVPVMMMLRHNNGTLMVKIRTTDVSGFLTEVKKNGMYSIPELPFRIISWMTNLVLFMRLKKKLVKYLRALQ